MAALIVGAGEGLSASLARLFAANKVPVAIASRQPGKLDALCAETNARAYQCDATSQEDVARLFRSCDEDFGRVDTVVYNPSYRTSGPLIDLDPEEVDKALAITAFGAFLVAQQSARRMLQQGKGTILFTGASASVKGYAKSAAFAMGKFALRGLVQSMARELQPRGIHVAHVVIDGAIASESRGIASDDDRYLQPDAIAETYWHLANQSRSAWSWEIEVRPWLENF